MEKERINVRRLSITLSLILLTAALTGGMTWYFMDQANQMNKSTIDSLKAQVEKTIDKADIVELDSDEESAIVNEKEEVDNFCKGGANNLKVVSYQHVNNENGDFILCSMGYVDGPTGFVVYAKKIDNNWKEIFKGQENPSAEIANQYKIPKDLFMSNPGVEDSNFQEFNSWKY